MDGTISVNIRASQIGLSRLLKRKMKVFRSFWRGCMDIGIVGREKVRSQKITIDIQISRV